MVVIDVGPAIEGNPGHVSVARRPVAAHFLQCEYQRCVDNSPDCEVFCLTVTNN